MTAFNETVFLGGCPVIRPEGIYVNGRRVIRIGLQGVGLGDVGDLLAYRQMWEPFIAAHLELWRDLNELLENNPTSKKCPTGIFDASKIQGDTTGFCATLALTRIRTSATDPGGILTQWNSWKDKSSADVVAGAASMLESQQNTVMRTGGLYAKELFDLYKYWGLNLQLPNIPSFSLQQDIRARIEGAYISTKGVIQLIGYSASSLLGEARDIVDATAKGLTDTAKAIPSTARTIGIVVAVAAVVVGGALIVYYVPKRPALPERATP
jgi:hypothetical protein